MKFIVSWSLPQATYNAAVDQFLKTGGMPQEGVKLIGRWHGMNGKGFAVVDTNAPKLLFKWYAEWSELLPLEITPCLEDEDAADVLAVVRA